MKDHDIIAQARLAFGNDARTNEECLILRIRQLERFRDERNEALNLIAAQAQRIARDRA